MELARTRHYRVDHHVHIEPDPRLDEVLFLLRRLARQSGQVMSAIDDLADLVATDTTVDQSAITLLEQLTQMLEEAIASGDPARLTALADTLRANQVALAAAVAANTPAAPTP